MKITDFFTLFWKKCNKTERKGHKDKRKAEKRGE